MDHVEFLAIGKVSGGYLARDAACIVPNRAAIPTIFGQAVD